MIHVFFFVNRPEMMNPSSVISVSMTTSDWFLICSLSVFYSWYPVLISLDSRNTDENDMRIISVVHRLSCRVLILPSKIPLSLSLCPLRGSWCNYTDWPRHHWPGCACNCPLVTFFGDSSSSSLGGHLSWSCHQSCQCCWRAWAAWFGGTVFRYHC